MPALAAQVTPVLAGVGAAAVALALALLVVVLVCRRRLAAGAARTAALAEEVARRRAVADAAPVACLYWTGGADAEATSTGFGALFATADRAPDELSALLERLDPEDAGRLRSALDRLRAEGEGFATTLATARGQRVLEATGVRLGVEGDGLDDLDIAWFRDVTDSVARESALASQHDRLRQLIDLVPTPVWRRRADLTIQDGNAAFAGAADAANLADALAADAEIFTESGRQLARRARDSGERRVERDHVVINGVRRLLEVTELPLAPGGDVIGFALDYTDVEEAERELARHVAAHGEVLEQLGTAIAIYGPDTRLTFHNTAFARLWRLDTAWLSTEPTEGEVLDALRDRRQLPEYADFRAFKRERLKLFTSLMDPLEELLHLPDGRTLRMVITPHPMGGLLFTFEDVTDRLALERSYNTLIDVQRDTLDNLYEGVAVFGGDGRIKLSNPAYARIWGLAADFLGTEPHVTDVVDRLKKYFEAGANWASLRTRIVDRAMDRMPMSGRLDRLDGSVLSYAKVPLPDGGVLWSYLDITDSIRVERALRERNEALETADRLKSEFIANVSYELRTPLNAIIGFAEILNNQYFGELNDRQKEYSEGVIEASNRLLSLINDILDLAMIEAGRMTLERSTVDIHALAVSVFNLTRDWARKQDLTIEFDCAVDIGAMVADERRLKQALFNLMSNAIKFTPAGGTVSLAARREAADVVFTVSDTGIGIPREDRARVFEKFERTAGTERWSTGVGLGLSLVQNFVELHGGRVEIESGAERGTRVICVLPTHTEPPVAAAKKAS